MTNLNRVARYDIATNNWTPFADNGLSGSSGFGGNIRSFLINENDLYVGGNFTQTHSGSNLNLNNIARYNLLTNSWSGFGGGGVNNIVQALAIYGNKLFVGGGFTEVQSGGTLNNIAIYDLVAGTWTGLPGNGLNSLVTSLSISGDFLYLGGFFQRTFDGTTMTNLNGVAAFQFSTGSLVSKNQVTSSDSWLHLGFNDGIALNREVRAIAAYSASEMFVGGYFSQTASGKVVNLNSIARFNPVTSNWSALGNNGLNSSVEGLAVSGDNLYVGGAFSTTNDSAITNLNRIARYNLTTNTWSALAENGLNSFVNAVALHGDDLYVAGNFTRTFDGTTTNLNRIARYNLTTNTWFPLAGNGLNSDVFTLTVSGDELYVGGSFSRTFDGATTDLNRIARYNTVTQTWSDLTDLGLNSEVFGLTSSDGNLFVRGGFTGTFNGATTLNRLARYNTADNTWSAITGDADISAAVRSANAVVRSGNDLFIGGAFSEVDSGVTRFFTRYYLQQWNVPSGNSDWFDGENWTTGDFPAINTNAVIPNGAGNINITTSDVTLRDLILSGGNLTVDVGRTLTINGMLVLDGGIINGGGTVVVTNCNPDSIMNAGKNSYIQTALVRCVNNTGTFNFPVGTLNGYSPVQLKNVAGTGNFTVKANQTAFSGEATGLPANRLQRFWDLTSNGVTSADLRFTYLASDVAGTENNYKVYRINGGTAQNFGGTINTVKHSALVEGVSGFSPWTLAQSVSPTASNVALSGRVLTQKGIGIGKITVSLTNSNGATRTVLTNTFGFYQFDEVPGGESYVVSVNHKKYRFDPSSMVINANDNIQDINFFGEN